VDLIHKRCAGLDVHQRTVVACARIVEDKVTEEVRTFETTTTGLLELSSWLEAQGCCVFRPDPGTDSDVTRPLVPERPDR
jgi:hypothetical protein